jgi:two-component system, NtrC family, sensor kinase
MGARTTLTAHGADARPPQHARRPARWDHGEAADKEVCGVARPWRIRHKLMLGLGLVVGIIALLLVGTFFGLLSYMAAMKTMTAKLVELRKVDDVKDAMEKLAALEKPEDARLEEPLLRERWRSVNKALGAYEAQLQETLQKGRDPDHGQKELMYIQVLRAGLGKLDKEITAHTTGPSSGTGALTALHDLPEIKGCIKELVLANGDLQQVIFEDLFKRIDVAKNAHRWSTIIVVTTSIFGVLAMACLLRFFNSWIFFPVRELEQGARRLAQGDFEHTIEVHSGDEMEELAAAFNYMTGQLREIYRDLNRQVHERSRQLVRSERLASVGFLAAGVAHEINNPLQAITLYSGALEGRLNDLFKALPATKAPDGDVGHAREEFEVITKYLKTILEEAFRCKRITERLLEVSRGGDGSREPINLVDLIQSVIRVAQPLQSCEGKTIVFKPIERLVAWINADEIKSVVLNLVVNALESMDEGGTLTIRLEQWPSRNGGSPVAELAFSDTGCGMPAEVLDNIFEPFFTRNRSGKGTGLGLTISHRIVTQHGGEIEASSPGLNLGSTFTVRLPMQPALEQPEAEGSRKKAEGREDDTETSLQKAA